jgi:GNAT superfamily N-acetyltransferase
VAVLNKWNVTASGNNIAKQVQIQRMELSHMEGLMKLKNAEGWNQLEKDWALLIHYREAVNLVAVLDKRILGSVTALNYANAVAWIGMMLVDQEYRGRGIGKGLMLAVMDKLDHCASIKLDATPAGRPLYLKLGFKDEYTLYRLTHPSAPQVPIGEDSLVPRPIRAGDLPKVAAYDREVFGADRTELITRLYEAFPDLAWLIEEKDRVTGFCLGRSGQNFTQLGPVHARAEKSALALIRTAINQIPGQALVVDIPADKAAVRLWLESQGFITQRPFERMYLKQNPHPGRVASVYLIAGPELG